MDKYIKIENYFRSVSLLNKLDLSKLGFENSASVIAKVTLNTSDEFTFFAWDEKSPRAIMFVWNITDMKNIEKTLLSYGTAKPTLQDEVLLNYVSNLILPVVEKWKGINAIEVQKSYSGMTITMDIDNGKRGAKRRIRSVYLHLSPYLMSREKVEKTSEILKEFAEGKIAFDEFEKVVGEKVYGLENVDSEEFLGEMVDEVLKKFEK